MLKKAGIVIAATVVSLLAVSPLAFADGGDHGKGHYDRGHYKGHDDRDDKNRDDKNRGHNNRGHDGGGLVNVSDIDVQVPVQLCGNDILSGVLGVLSGDQRNSSSDKTDCEQDNSSR